MIQTVKKRMTVPPYWGNVAIGGLSLMFGCFAFAHQLQNGRNARMSFGLICGSLYILIESFFHWTICEKGIWIRFLWIPVRLIKWDQVDTAEGIYKWYTGAKGVILNGQGIFVTLKGCPCFSPEVDALNMFVFRHPFRSLFIRYTPRRRDAYVALFQRYYPELEFQIGYQEHFEKGK